MLALGYTKTMSHATIHYGNSYSKITGLSVEQFKELRALLSYKVDFQQAKYIPNPANRVKYCIDLKGNFATGLYNRVCKWLFDSGIWLEVLEVERKPLSGVSRAFNDPTLKPYDSQHAALMAALEVDRGVISMPTGTGKSKVIEMLIYSLVMKTLVVVPTLELKQQLTKSLKERFPGMEGITVENIDSTALNKATNYDLLIIDECHRSAAKTYRDLNKKAWSGIRYRYCFTATPFRNDPEEQLLYEGIAGQVIYQLTYKEAIAKSYIVPVEAYFYELPKVEVKGYSYAEVYSELVVNRQDRNELLATLLKQLWVEKKSTLCLVKEVRHGKILSDLTGIPFSSGSDEDSRQWIETFKQGRLKCLIATEGLLSEGVDTKPCEFVVLASPGKARSALMQKIGRAIRNYPGKTSAKVIMIKDKSHRFMLTHYNTSVKIVFEEYGIKPVKLEFG